MKQGLTAVAQQSTNKGLVYALRTKTRIDVAIAREVKGGWIWALRNTTKEHYADSLAACIYAVEERLGIPHDEPQTVSPLKRVKVGDQSYELRDRDTGELIGTAVKTGTDRDNYPWNWSVEGTDGVGVADTLKSCVAAVALKRTQ